MFDVIYDDEAREFLQGTGIVPFAPGSEDARYAASVKSFHLYERLYYHCKEVDLHIEVMDSESVTYHIDVTIGSHLEEPLPDVIRVSKVDREEPITSEITVSSPLSVWNIIKGVLLLCSMTRYSYPAHAMIAQCA